ncbi:hypothetical protein ASC77_05980 [Nocardioides sp. Root1257]|uniref:eCIS core domain-containing protein n=1 Tax=unclassified Nocardioides TaxID=2615069 RepID=UPI0006FF75FB|nr:MULTISPECIES: DUF4157 domain-containing protein [unclassified Nocardioides]KQW48309.1 hypothetical protein ASC77_05980 [Nocardioides sp. Root1257]KRC47483.1 hypothetical protein ASE24_05980 [Nocardioides sp. Root224]
MGAGPVYAEPEREQQPSQDVIEPESAPAAPVPLVVGAADDRAEVDADRRADDALARLAPHREHDHDHAHGVRRSARAPSGAIGLAGGALDGGTEQRLTSRLGRGGALDAGVRRRMEGAFGSSFAHVNVHTDGEADALSRQMSATAFTVGNDMFFSQGAYRPGDESGERLIAHELAHVEQQGAGAHRMVHRAVGFEFETNVIVKRRRNTLRKRFEPYGKTAVLKQYDGFRMEADEHSDYGSAIEFVVDPPLGEDQRDKLETIMEQMVADVERMRAAAGKKAVTKADTAYSQVFQEKHDEYREEESRLQDEGKDRDEILDEIGTFQVPDRDPSVAMSDTGVKGADPKAWIHPTRNVIANPQVTGGVAFDKLLDLMAEMGQAGDKTGLSEEHATGAEDLDKVSGSTKGPAIFAGRVETVPAPKNLMGTPSKQLKALVAILAMYVHNGKFVSTQDTPPLSYAKLLSGSMLMRTDFASMFNRLDQMERQDVRMDPDAFAAWVLDVADLPGTEAAKVYERGILKDYHAGLQGGIEDAPGLQITRGQWLSSIVFGQDMLSAKSNPAIKDKLEGLGRLGNKFDSVGEGGFGKPSGVIMEFRNMARAVPVSKWTALATSVYDYLVSVNEREKERV